MNLPLELSQIVGWAAEASPLAVARARILVAGEFSSGKTCLVNGLLGETLLPSSVTSTSLPPIWISQGDGAPECVGVDGQVQGFASLAGLIEHVSAADLERIHHCRIAHPSPALQHFDLIDTPGSSDPNIPSACWERMVDHADMIVWCSSSVQAWRQSEKSAWLAVPEEVAARSILVLSHADRLTDPVDREKVLRRVTREAEGLFASIRLASFVSDDDVAGLLADLRSTAATLPRRPSRPVVPTDATAPEPADTAAPRIVPRRIRLNSAGAEPLLLVTPIAAPAEPAAQDPAPLPADEAAEGMAPPPAEAEAVAEPPVRDRAAAEAAAEPAMPAAAEAPAVEPETDDLLDLVSHLAGTAETAEAPLPESPPDEAEDSFMALLRGAIEAVEDTPEPEPQFPAQPAAPDSMAEPAQGFDGDIEEAAALVVADPPVEAAAGPVPVEPVPADPAVEAARPAARAPAAPAIFGPARMLWTQILPTLDLDDPDSLLDGIEQLVGELDLNWAQACLAQSAPAPRRRRGSAT
ncbi:dynamin family protein [Cereibacter sphaeroides]|uniref:dynamin family protein n=1 Tax=Cereibacter sphaeroides TaxID=1063 RepID=UPI001F18634A|nr:dynamin family protein [Cereibacter sphaeroides]MCE6951387.1 dynamin family protein [Cereibacter sphaeroides]